MTIPRKPLMLKFMLLVAKLHLVERTWRVADVTEMNESHVLKIVPYKHDRFNASMLISSTNSSNDNKYPGIPLSSEILRYEEDRHKISCVCFTLVFKDSEGKSRAFCNKFG